MGISNSRAAENRRQILAGIRGDSTTGDVFYVSSTASGKGDTAGHGKTPSVPFATIDFAIGQTTENVGDVIIVMPKHAETVTGTSAITFDKAGISIVGMGHWNQRPRILMDGAATVKNVVSAADVRIENIVFVAGHEDIVTCFSLTAEGTWLNEVEFADLVATENFLIPISVDGADNTSDGLMVTHCRWQSIDTASTEFITLTQLVDGPVIQYNFVQHTGTATAQLIAGAAGAAMTRCDVRWNYLAHLMTSGELFLTFDTACSGIVAHNFCTNADVSSAQDMGLDGLALGLHENYSAGTDATQGALNPIADTPLT